jgi:hypothetical protein
MFGPPDEIGSHPGQGYEKWLYRSGALADVWLEFRLQ